MGKVGRSLEMPSPAALDQFDPATGVMFGKRRQRARDIALPRVDRDLVERQRLLRREQRRLDRAEIFVVAHAARRTRSSAKGASWSRSTRPCRASSRAATKLLASAERR